MNWKRLNPKNWFGYVFNIPSESKGSHYDLGSAGYERIGEYRMSSLTRTEFHPDGQRTGYISFRHGINDEPDSMSIQVGGNDMSANIKLERDEALSLAKFIKDKFKVVIVEIED